MQRAIIMVAIGRAYDPIDRGIDILIGRLRKLIGDDACNTTVVCSVRGQGYWLNVRVSLD